MVKSGYLSAFILTSIISLLSAGGCNNNDNAGSLPDEIQEIMNQPRYADAVWSLRTVDFETGELIYNLNPDRVLFTGSLRKTFSSGVSLDSKGPGERFRTPVHFQGEIDDDGVLDGDLILLADGDLTFGGRVTPQDTIQFTDFDHVDANVLGGAILTPQDPLTGLNSLASQIASAGINEINGDVVVDARLFDEFVVPNESRLISPIIVNENLIDVTIIPTEPGEPAIVDWRPKSASLNVEANVMTIGTDGEYDIELSEPDASCFESGECVGTVTGQIPAGYEPDITGLDTVVQTFKIEAPAAYARTAFIEALEREGVTVNADSVGPNPVQILPPEGSYTPDTLLAEYVSPPFSEMIKLVLKVSHNYGANLSLILFGLTKGVRTVDDSLEQERIMLTEVFGVPGNGFDFPTNGSGSPDSEASPRAVTTLLQAMSMTDVITPYFAAFPILGVDGSLKFVDPGSVAAGNVRAKTGTSVGFDPDIDSLVIRAKALGGFIDAVSGRRVIFAVFVNNVPIQAVSDVQEINDDLARIATAIYSLN